jgi:glucan phosphorylase
MVKRLHEYKRQLPKVLHIITPTPAAQPEMEIQPHVYSAPKLRRVTIWQIHYQIDQLGR